MGASSAMRSHFALIPLFALFLGHQGASQFLEYPCGSPIGSRISGGSNANFENSIYMAAIFNQSNHFQCGGTVINKLFILTAAHCLDTKQRLYVNLGAYYKYTPKRQYDVSYGLQHRDYNKFSGQNDIGLLKLANSVDYNRQIQPMCIYLNKEIKKQLASVQTFEAFGWGRKRDGLESDILQTITLNQLNQQYCKSELGESLNSTQICAGVSNGDTCEGDSGDWIQETISKYKDMLPAKSTPIPPVPQNYQQVNRPVAPEVWINSVCGGDGNSMTSIIRPTIYGPDFKAQGVLIADLDSCPSEMQSYFAWIPFFTLFLVHQGFSRLLENNCGSAVGVRIVGGIDASEAAAVHMAAIYNKTQFLCGGTLIHRLVKLGALKKSEPLVEYAVSDLIKHPNFDRWSYLNDIGLLKLSASVNYNPRIQPICIYLNKLFKSQVDVIPKFQAFGWGVTRNRTESDILQTITLNRVDPNQCRNQLHETLRPTQICAGVPNGDTCRGDSGGVYTDVTSYVDWIEQTINNSTAEPQNPSTKVRPEQPRNFNSLVTSNFPELMNDYCAQDSMKSIIRPTIYGPDFKALGVLIHDQRLKPICMLAKDEYQRMAQRTPPFAIFDNEQSKEFVVYPSNPKLCKHFTGLELNAYQICVNTPIELNPNQEKIGDILVTHMNFYGRKWIVLLGIVSYSSDGAYVFTNVIGHTKWIWDKINNNQN
ncbi:hypothetical protein M5D96_007186 [Drosophila gunungcola]|uniref:Peptidase S1 domain-containing protein n=1 Tax=Drosophila gunungcola TaxID=103775 RepID=A0A9P9YNL3_9MUSC|nr:hypothetical protein M5D96_007186 [Drosophila gunungcola]